MDYYFDSVHYSSNLLYGVRSKTHYVDNDLGDHLGYPFHHSDEFDEQANRLANRSRESIENYDNNEGNDCSRYVGSMEPFCHLRSGTLLKLKDSTRKLLTLVEEIQAKIISKHKDSNQDQLTELIKSIPTSSTPSRPTPTLLMDLLSAKAIKRLEKRAKALNLITIKTEDDCSIYKRLTGKCNCLNQVEYNDLIIHFNDSARYFTSMLGELIKNMRIVKRFLYMGGNYTKNALLFLENGLLYSTLPEKIDIAQGCAHADVCNVFSDKSIVEVCISWHCYEACRDTTTACLAASFLYKLAQIEEGRKYLNFSSKITIDFKKALEKKYVKLDYATLELIHDTLNIMHPPLTQYTEMQTYYCRPSKNEGCGSKAFTALLQYRKYMTLQEVFTHLGLLNNLSNNSRGQGEITMFLSPLLNLFMNMLMEYDDSKMNIIISNIMNNVISWTMVKKQESLKSVVMADVATQPIEMKTQTHQFPPVKSSKRGIKCSLR